MKKFSLKSWISQIQQVALRFPFTLFFVIGLAFNFFLQINKHHVDIQPHTWAFLYVGTVMSLAVTLFLEDLKNLYTKIGLNLLSIILLLVYLFTLPDKFLPVHYYQLIILGVVFSLSAFFGSFIKPKNDIPFWEFSKNFVTQFIISAIFAQVLMLGLSLAILSLKELFKVEIHNEVYQNVAVICYVLFAPIFFLANIPDATEKLKQRYSFPIFLKILGLYILLPILALYSLILYVYLIQIVIGFELPNGWVSTLVSILGLGGFFCMLVLYPLRLDDENKNKVVNIFSRYFPILLFPLLMLMSIGIFRRLGDYGLTINRCYVLILNLWLYGISTYLFITKANHLKWMVISFAAVTFCSTVGPWSVFSVTKRTLTKEIGQLLSETKLLKNGKVLDNTKQIVKIDSLSSKKLSEDIKYICENFGTSAIQPYFKDSIQKLDSWKINEILGVDKSAVYASEHHSAEYQYFNASQDTNNELVDISQNYISYIRLHRSNEDKYLINTKKISVRYLNNSLVISRPEYKKSLIIPLQSKIKEILSWDKKQKHFSAVKLTIAGENSKLVINNIAGFYSPKNDSITVTEFRANLFLK